MVQLRMLGFWQRESGEGRTYEVMWKKYQRRILLAMSSQAFAQLVRTRFQVSEYVLIDGLQFAERDQW